LSSLADRIRGVVGAANRAVRSTDESRISGESRPSSESRVSSEFRLSCESRIPNPESRDLSPLGGSWRGETYVVERLVPPHARLGPDTVGALADRLDRSSEQAALYAGEARPPLVFFDLETTGLSGGAGTQAFLVGSAWFDDSGAFVTRQFLLTRMTDERPMLDTVAGELARAGSLVSFNGKSFDAPVLETRYLFHRLSWNGRQMPHVDVLHPARRFWKRGIDDFDCSLVALERQILGVRRGGDVPGVEIPSRYFHFIRSGDARPLAAVLEHNRRDLLALAALTARLLHITRQGPDAARDAREALALGHVYLRAGSTVRACEAYRRAVALTERGAVSQVVRIESLRALALGSRRARLHAEAAACWRRLADTPGCPPRVVREATEALAVHHEHRERDLVAARACVLRGLEIEPRPRWVAASRYRLARLDRKMAGTESLKLEL
jgi:uncharacterized protein YprB with RNaseH-like and TPR domain